jgi:CubicO group peptidase (beta-lactamase class C family)
VSLADSVEKVLSRMGAPGASVALFSADSIQWAEGFGWADRAEERRADAQTVFRAGSLSKSVTAAVTMQLVEKGAIRLDEPVNELAPDVAIHNPWAESHPVRLAHLLEHTAGFDDLPLREYLPRRADISLEAGFASGADARRVRWPPGPNHSRFVSSRWWRPSRLLGERGSFS